MDVLATKRLYEAQRFYRVFAKEEKGMVAFMFFKFYPRH